MELVRSVLEQSASTIHHEGGAVAAAALVHDGTRLAREFAAMGVGPGDRVAVWAPNGLGYVRCLAAAAVGRFVLVSVNSRYGPIEAAELVARAGASLLVVDETLDVGAMPDDLDRIVVSAIEAGIRAGGPDDLPGPSADPIWVAEADDPFVVFTTSGTTSRPKMVLHRQGSIAAHAFDVARALGYDRGERVLVALPLCGVFGLCSFMGAIAGGADVWLPGAFDVASAASVIGRVGITALNGSDDMFHRLLETGADLGSVRRAGYARFNSSLDGVVARADAAGVTMAGLYGMSEVQALFAVRDPGAPRAARELGGGRCVSAAAGVRVVDPDTGEPVVDGVDGELQLRGPSLFAGYLAEGGAQLDAVLTDTNHVVDADGTRWFCTGDLGHLEPDGSFAYVTRMADVLRLGGFLVSPSEIEAVVLECTGVAEAQVVAVARPGGVRPVAVVVADCPVDEAAVIAHCRSRLATFKCPIAVIEVDAFPTTSSANGTKIQRVALRALAEATLAAGHEDGPSGSPRRHREAR